MFITRPIRALTALALSSMVLAGCSAADSDESANPDGSAPHGHSHEHGRPTPRLVVSYDGGVRVLDAGSLAQVADLPRDGFLRLNSAGDSRHVLVTTDRGFELLDTGTWRQTHGDHSHYRTATPAFTGVSFDGPEAGHAVPHDGRITLFFDGAGDVRIIDSEALSTPDAPTQDYLAPHPHHGVAVARADGSLVVSRGDEHSRTGIAVLDAARVERAQSTDCPGVHGEAAAADGVLTFGCEDGILTVRGDQITKIGAPDPYGRIGNQRGSTASTVVLGDYKTRRPSTLGAGEIERPRRFSLTDTAAGTLTIIDLPTSYSFRSLARGSDGEAVILGTDGALYVYDPATGEQIARHPVIAPWSEPVRWQEPMPAVATVGSVAYVSDPATTWVTAVDLVSGRQLAHADLGVAPVETVAVTG